MTQFFKTYWPLLALGAALLGLWLWKRNEKPTNKIDLEFTAPGNLQNILSMAEGRYANRQNERGLGLYIDVPLNTIVKNKGSKDITLENMAGNISFEGEPIFQTRANSQSLKNVNAPAKSKKPVVTTDGFQVLINEKTIKFFRELLKGMKPKVDYMLNASVLGVPYLFKNSTVVNQEKP